MASGNTMFIFLATDNVPPAADGATFDTFAAAEGNRPVLDFAGAGQDEAAFFGGAWPSEYAGGGIDVVIHYSMDGVVGAAVQWEIQAEVVQDNDDQDAAGQDFLPATPVDITDTPIGTLNQSNITAAGVITHANCGSPVVGDRFRLKVARDFDHATNADDAQLHAVVITET